MKEYPKTTQEFRGLVYDFIDCYNNYKKEGIVAYDFLEDAYNYIHEDAIKYGFITNDTPADDIPQILQKWIDDTKGEYYEYDDEEDNEDDE